jgi:hypothetical protein
MQTSVIYRVLCCTTYILAFTMVINYIISNGYTLLLKTTELGYEFVHEMMLTRKQSRKELAQLFGFWICFQKL